MTFERVAESTSPGGLLSATSAMEEARRISAAGPIPVAARLQILATEHWSLLATRSMLWNEVFSRSSMFLATLSGAIVALALAAQATSFGPGFLAFALVVLPVVLFIGLATFDRLLAANDEDVLWVQGMNRLRHAYVELAPDLEPYLIAGWHDDATGVLQTFGAPAGTHPLRHHVFVTTPAVIAVVDAAIAGTIAALIALQLRIEAETSIDIGVAAFLTAAALLVAYQYRAFVLLRSLPAVRFPTPAEDGLIHR